MQRFELDNFLDNYIEGYLFTDLLTIKNNVPTNKHPGNAAYLMTGAICSGIELLGSLVCGIKTIPACACGECKEQSFPNNPFDYYCKNYLSKVDPRYEKFGPILSQLIRNGIAHSFATKGKIGITRVDNGNDLHLVRMSTEEFLIINPDRLFDDFKKSYEQYYLPDVAEGAPSRQAALDGYAWLKAKYGKDIDNTIGQMKKLDSWPVIHGDLVYRGDMVEIVEANGDMLVS